MRSGDEPRYWVGRRPSEGQRTDSLVKEHHTVWQSVDLAQRDVRLWAVQVAIYEDVFARQHRRVLGQTLARNHQFGHGNAQLSLIAGTFTCVRKHRLQKSFRGIAFFPAKTLLSPDEDNLLTIITYMVCI